MRILFFLLISHTLFASNEQHIEVGSRADNRLNLPKEHSKEEWQLTECEQNISCETCTSLKKCFGSPSYYTSHQGAYHNPYEVSPLGDKVELEDGSIWTVCPSHRYKTLDWLTGDAIIIVYNHEWCFSDYQYRLINMTTNANVKVNLYLGPLVNGIYTHWIAAIDYGTRKICLEDGSVWEMSGLEASIFNYWQLFDTVIIGINDGWFSGSNPNILINVNTNTSVMGECLYQ